MSGDILGCHQLEGEGHSISVQWVEAGDAALASYNWQDSPLKEELSSTKCEWCETEKLSFSKKETFVEQ